MRGELGAGAGFQSGKNSVGVAATGKGIKTFSFGTEAEARAFADQLRAEPTKFNEIFGHFRSADEVRPDEVSLEVGGKFHVELGESELDVSGGVEITRRDDETMSVAVKAEIEAAVPGLGAKAGCEFKIETNKNGTAVEASARLTLESTAGASVEETVKSILGGTTKVTGESAEMKAGSRVEVEYKWDLADPVTAAQLRAIVDKMRSGSASIHDLQQLNKEATVIVKLSSVESTEQKWEAGIENKFVTAKAKVAVHQEGNLTSSVLIKPAGNTALIRAR